MQFRRIVLTLGLSILATVVVAQAQQLGQQPAPPSSAATGLIAGRVIDLGNGKPVSEAMVTVQVGLEPLATDLRVLTDPDGRFVFVNVPAGRYTLQAYKLGYLPGEFGQRVYQGERKKLDVTAGQIATDLTVPLWKWAALGGTVTDEAGQPVVGVRVMAYRRSVSMGQTQFEPFNPANARAITDDRGVFRITALPPGEFAAGVPVNLATMPAEFVATLGSPGTTIPLQAYMTSAELGPLGQPRNQQVGASVLMGDSRSLIPPAPTADSMPLVYRTTFSPAATKAAEATVVALEAGQERSDLDIVLRPVHAVRVSGQLMGPDGPMPQLSISLFATGEYQAAIGSINNHTVSTLTDANGRFTMLGVPEGDYIASAYLSSQTDVTIATVDDPIHVGSADVTDLTLTARRATRVFGKYDLRGAKPPAALNTMWVLLDLPPGGRRTMGLIPRADLTFDTHMPAGRYLPSFGAPQGLACTSILQGGKDVSDALVVGTDPLELTVVCTDSPNRLTGTTRKDDGAADPDAMIVVFPADRQMWTGTGYSPRRFRNTPSQNAGAFNLINLPPGDYFVAAIQVDKSNLWQDAKRLDLIARSATRVSIGATDVRTVDLRTMVTR